MADLSLLQGDTTKDGKNKSIAIKKYSELSLN